MFAVPAMHKLRAHLLRYPELKAYAGMPKVAWWLFSRTEVRIPPRWTDVRTDPKDASRI